MGARYGERVLELRPLRRRRERIDRARRYLRDNGGRAVFVGRFTAFLRAVMPGLAGISHLPYRRFLLFNATGGLLWGTGFTLLGCLAGASYTRVEKTVGRASLGLLVLIALAGFGAWLRARRRSAAKPSATAAPDRHRERRPPVISPSSAASPTSTGVS